MLSDFCDELNKRRKLIAEYIQALIDTREQENINIFLDRMARHHCQHLASDIDQYTKTVMDEVVDKAFLGRENDRYFVVCG